MQQAPPQPQLDPQEIASETGKPVAQVAQDIAQSGATTKEELYPAIYGQGDGQQGIDPSVAQGAMGMPTSDGQGAPMAMPPPQGPPTRMRAQAAMRGQPMDESESPAEAAQEAGMPGAEAAEGIQPNVAMAAHSSRRPAMHRAMKGKPAHVAAGRHRGRRV
jgi:hypothetical protein